MKEEIPLITRDFIIRLICKGTVREILNGGQRVQPVPPGNSVTLATNIKEIDTGNNIKKEKPFTRGNPTSLPPKYIGIKQFPKPPYKPGITKQNIINNP